MEKAVASRERRAARHSRASCLALLLGLAAGVASARPPAPQVASCVSTKSRPLQAIGAIRLLVDADPPWLAELARRAAAMWNDPGCNVAHGFPRIDLDDPGEPHRTIRVRWIDGSNPAEPRSCGSFVGADIVLYGRALDPRTGQMGGCGTPERRVETLAHELGHALGLMDRFERECYGSIMSQLVWASDDTIQARSVRADECLAADLGFQTPSERRRLSRRPVLLATLAAASEPGAGEGLAASALLTLPGAEAPLPPRSARIAPDSRGRGSDGYRP